MVLRLSNLATMPTRTLQVRMLVGVSHVEICWDVIVGLDVMLGWVKVSWLVDGKSKKGMCGVCIALRCIGHGIILRLLHGRRRYDDDTVL
mmetsp:Transcript_24242/g.59340  ORF Transcript_24242/g.59340 Transcript_24242/m.59340 type:complete len:90 (-) Transcript_24242:52-321(-)